MIFRDKDFVKFKKPKHPPLKYHIYGISQLIYLSLICERILIIRFLGFIN